MVFEFISIYGNGIKNTIIYCFLAVLVALIINPIAAYALSRYNLPTQYKLLLFFITTVAFPTMVTMIPSYLLLKDLGLLNTFSALILPGAASGYSIFLLKGFFDSLPQELYEASDIDGASEWFKFWSITIKLSKPILAVIALGAFTVSYSNFMYAFVLCQDSEMWTLMVWLYQLQYYSAQGVQFASLLVSAVPTLIVFILAQRVIIRGIVVPQEK
jgi:multiple sugar transport system permease protein